MLRAYQTTSWMLLSPTPDNSLWKGKGTTIEPPSLRPSNQLFLQPTSRSSKANSHSPFKFSHCSRTNCGRGYSGRGTPACVSAMLTKPALKKLFEKSQLRRSGMFVAPRSFPFLQAPEERHINISLLRSFGDAKSIKLQTFRP